MKYFKTKIIIYFDNPKYFSEIFKKKFGIHVCETTSGYTREEFLHLLSHPKFTRAHILSIATEIGILNKRGIKFQGEILKDQLILI